MLIGRLFVVFSIAIEGAPFFCGAHEEAPLFVVHTHLSLQTRRVLQQGVRIPRTFSALQVVHAPHAHLVRPMGDPQDRPWPSLDKSGE